MSGFEFNSDDAGEDSAERTFDWGGRDASIFVIDANMVMFVDDSNASKEATTASHFAKAIKCAHSTLCRKIISNNKDPNAIVLINAKNSKNNLDFAHIYVLQDLGLPGAERVQELEEDNNIIKEKFGGSCLETLDSSIHDILWVCRSMFNNWKTKLSTKTILFFTCKDSPHEGDDHKVRQALKGAKDLNEASISLEILPMGNTFNMNSFYKDILLEVSGPDSYPLSILTDPTERFEDLLDCVNRLEHSQRSSGRVSLMLAPGVECGVKVFSAIRKAYKPSKLNLYKVTNEEVRSQRKEFLEETGELLYPSDYVKFQVYGGKKITFTIDESRSLKKVYETGIEILGFKQRSFFKPEWFVKPANFIYHDEIAIKGSAKMFSCLLNRCLERDIFPLVRVVPRQGSSVQWGFLLPQSEEKDERSNQIQAPGFYICYLPFTDDIRQFEIDNRTRADISQVDKAKEFVRKLRFDFNPESFENPDLQTHWRSIEALALNRCGIEPVTDYTIPKYDRILRKAGALIEEWKSLVLPSGYDPEEVRKRKAASSYQPQAKKPKIATVTSNNDRSVEEMAKSNKVDKLNMNELKQWLTGRGTSVTGKKKAQLVQDVYDRLNN